MYYAVLRKEIKMPCSGGELTLRVGGVYEVRNGDSAQGTTVQYRSMDLSAFTPEPHGPWYEMSVKSAREHFVCSSRDLNAVIEESFMVCEAAYC